MTFMCDICGEDLYNGQSYMVTVRGAGVESPVREHNLCRTLFRGQMDLHKTHHQYCHKKGCEMYPPPTRVR